MTDRRRPYVGEGADGARRSAQIDLSEADGMPPGEDRDVRLLSAERWQLQAERLERVAATPQRGALVWPEGNDPSEYGCAGPALRDLQPYVEGADMPPLPQPGASPADLACPRAPFRPSRGAAAERRTPPPTAPAESSTIRR